MTDSSIRELLATIVERVDGISRNLEATRVDLQKSEDKSDRSRGHMHNRIDGVQKEIHDLRLESSGQASALEGLKAAVVEVQAVTDDVKNMRQKAQGAGTLGRWLITVGGWLLGAVASALALYTSITGKPPP